MEEDVLGPREEVVGDRYTRCTRCGTTVPLSEVRLILTEGGTFATEQEELGESCRRALESGEADWQTPELDDTE